MLLAWSRIVSWLSMTLCSWGVNRLHFVLVSWTISSFGVTTRFPNCLLWRLLLQLFVRKLYSLIRHINICESSFYETASNEYLNPIILLFWWCLVWSRRKFLLLLLFRIIGIFTIILLWINIEPFTTLMIENQFSTRRRGWFLCTTTDTQ